MKTGEANVPDVRKHTGAIAVVLVTLARWEVGLVVPKGDPKRVAKISHLSKRGVRLVAREPGSGARRLLDRELKEAGIPLDVAKNAQVVASGHLEAAQAVSMGAADVGIATRDVMTQREYRNKVLDTLSQALQRNLRPGEFELIEEAEREIRPAQPAQLALGVTRGAPQRCR